MQKGQALGSQENIRVSIRYQNSLFKRGSINDGSTLVFKKCRGVGERETPAAESQKQGLAAGDGVHWEEGPRQAHAPSLPLIQMIRASPRKLRAHHAMHTLHCLPSRCSVSKN